MGRTACTEPQCLYKGAIYLFLTFICMLTGFSKDEFVGFSQTSVYVYQLTRCNITDESYRQKQADIKYI